MKLTWHDDLKGCPSQCLAEVMGPHGVPYVLYLRWRHEDPWEAYFIRNSTLESMATSRDWSKDVFAKHNVKLSIFTELESVKQWLIGIWESAMARSEVWTYFDERNADAK